jgi:hypothetical protein
MRLLFSAKANADLFWSCWMAIMIDAFSAFDSVHDCTSRPEIKQLVTLANRTFSIHPYTHRSLGGLFESLPPNVRMDIAAYRRAMPQSLAILEVGCGSGAF